MSIVAALSLFAGVAHAGCPAPVSTDDIQSALSKAEMAYGDLDVDAFDAATDEAVAMVPCISEPMTRQLAASLHRFVGLRKFVSRDLDHARESFAAARVIEPGYKFPTTFVPEGNPVLKEYAALDPASEVAVEVPTPKGGYLLFDGSIGTARPTTFPVIVQVMNGDGTVAATDYVEPGEAMPVYEAGAADLPGSDHPLRAPLAAGAGGLALLSGAFYALSWSAHGNWNAADDVASLDKFKHQSNNLFLGSVGAGAAAVGLGVGAVFTAEF